MIKVFGLTHKREKQSYPSISLFMFHMIYGMYNNVNKKEEIGTAMVLTSTTEHEEDNKVNKKIKDSRNNDENNQPLLQKMIIQFDLNEIQPRTTQVFNCDEIGSDPNRKWNKVICTYKFFKVNKCGRCKLESKHHYGSHYLSLPELMVNSSRHP